METQIGLKSEIFKENSLPKRIFNILLIPSILISTANTLLLMTNPYLQEYIFELTELIKKENRIFKLRILGGT
jgi:hypothetical protein